MKNGKIGRFISKPDLNKLLVRLSRDTHLAAPVDVNGAIVFGEVMSADSIVFDYENCLNAPKDYMFLNDEPLFNYDLERLKIKKRRPSNAEGVIFGSRPCDTKAVWLMDRFFSRRFEDPVYFNKRNAITIITLACPRMWEGCFCTSVNGGPYLENGFDVQLTDIGKGYFLESGSERGRDFVKRFLGLTGDIDDAKMRRKEKIVREARASKGIEFSLGKVRSNLDRSDVKDELWGDLSRRCQRCGGCLLICPACSCFYVVDKRVDEKEGQRVRSLDACYYEGFTRMAGPYNPVRPGDMMMKRKFYHKLHQQVSEFGEPGCTGCGRCSNICPGNINWLETLKRIGRGE